MVCTVRHPLVWLGCACCATWSARAHAADPSDASVEQTATESVAAHLLRKAILDYPTAAGGAHGDVALLVDVDASGAVHDVRIESGPEVFHAAAVTAGRTLVFAPARVDGSAVASTVRVYFHFAPSEPTLGEDDLIEVIVHGDDPDREDTHARTTLDEATLEQSAGDDLAETLEQVPGVTLGRGSGDTAKPIIRGHQERRLLVLNDGIRHESQKWGPDHATEIDPFSAGSISVVRGAAGVRYGPDAIGGVVLVEPPPLRTEVGWGGKAVAAYTTNGRRPYGAVRVDAVPAGLDALTVRMEGNYARGASPRTPTYVLGNTASETWNLGASAQYRWATGQVRVRWQHHDLRAGVFYGVQNSTPSEFEEQLGADRPPTADLWSTDYAIDRPYQDVQHDLVSANATTSGGWGVLEATYAFQLNRRREFEQARASVTAAQFDFLLRTHTLDAAWEHPRMAVGAGEVSGRAGLQGVFQENVFRGVALMPNYRSFSGGVFGIERLAFGRVDLEAGARYDHLDRTGFLSRQDYEKHLRRETLAEGDCTETDAGGGRCPQRYDTGTLTLGGLVHVVPEVLDVKLDLSSASRFPNVDELYLIGSAPSFPVYALGNPSLGVETSWSGSTTVGLHLPWAHAELSGYASRIDRYVYFSPERNEDGTLHYDVTIRGTWPTYGYQPIDAQVSGLDGSLEIAPEAPVGLDVVGALVRATDRATGEQLIGTPPDQLSVQVAVRPRHSRLENTEISVRTDHVARQSRVAADADFAPAPKGYTLLGASARTQVTLGGRSLRLGIEGRNLLNTRYREYTSLLRYYADQTGRSVRFRVGVDI